MAIDPDRSSARELLAKAAPCASRRMPSSRTSGLRALPPCFEARQCRLPAARHDGRPHQVVTAAPSSRRPAPPAVSLTPVSGESHAISCCPDADLATRSTSARHRPYFGAGTQRVCLWRHCVADSWKRELLKRSVLRLEILSVRAGKMSRQTPCAYPLVGLQCRGALSAL